MVLNNKKLLTILSFGALLGVFLIITIFILKPHKFTKENKNFENITPSTTSKQEKPFWELTIESMRQRKYISKLNDLNLYRDNLLFKSYLTSYISDSLKINGLLTIPKTEKPVNGFPAIVFIHGYIPPNKYRTTERYIDYINSFANAGFVVFKIDLRGHGESEGEATGTYFSQNYIIDTLNAYDALKNADFVNKDAIGLWGHSMAGNIVARAMAVNPEIKGGVIFAGAVYTYEDMMVYGIGDNSYVPPPTITGRRRTRQALIDLYGEPKIDTPFWNELAPANYIEDFGDKIQIHHAINDDVVSVEYSRNLVALANEKNIKISYFEYKTGGHNLTGTTFNQALRESINFYNQKLID
jgi:dipeptidyl aminopeptidase/acylaminoacyl peptidase